MNYLGDKNEEMFSRAANLVRLALTKTTPEKIAENQWDNEWPYKGAFLFFAAKSFKSYQAIYTLCSSGFFQDAAVLHRTVFEIFLQALYMAEDPRPRAKLFMKHDVAGRFFRYLKLSKYPELVDAIEKRQDELEKLELQFKEVEEEYKRNKGWWGADLRWLAGQLPSDNNAAEKNYLKLYPLYSDLIHSTSTSVKYYIFDEDGFEADYEPSRRGAKLAAFPLATACVLLTAHVAAAVWELAEDAPRLVALAKEVSVISE